jgi:hypothetical protein
LSHLNYDTIELSPPFFFHCNLLLPVPTPSRFYFLLFVFDCFVCFSSKGSGSLRAGVSKTDIDTLVYLFGDDSVGVSC